MSRRAWVQLLTLAALWGAVFLAEKITLSAIAGLLAIVVGSLLAARRAEPAPL